MNVAFSSHTHSLYPTRQAKGRMGKLFGCGPCGRWCDVMCKLLLKQVNGLKPICMDIASWNKRDLCTVVTLPKLSMAPWSLIGQIREKAFVFSVNNTSFFKTHYIVNQWWSMLRCTIIYSIL